MGASNSSSFEGDRTAQTPRRAIVSPRVRTTPGGATEPLDRVIQRLIDCDARGMVLLLGTAGGGKTTALHHLRATLQSRHRITFYDEPPLDALPVSCDSLAIVALRDEVQRDWLVRLELAPWQEDDWIEYCASRRREECRRVLERLRADDAKDLLKGSPQLWHIVLDRLAADDRLTTALSALHDHVDAVLPAGADRDHVAALAAAALVNSEKPMRLSDLPRDTPPYVITLLRHRAVRVLLAAALLRDKLAIGEVAKLPFLAEVFPIELLRETAAAVRSVPAAMKQLDQMLRGHGSDCDATAASILLAADRGWRPADGRAALLSNARLPRACWRGIDLRGAELISTNLQSADLQDATLLRAKAIQADFTDAVLVNANLRSLVGREATFAGADLARANAMSADLTDADLSSANLRDADLSYAQLSRANLTGAKLIGTRLDDARLAYTNFEDADLIGVSFKKANLFHVRLCAAANVSAVCFLNASLLDCELEGVRMAAAVFREANLTGSYLTGTFFPRGDFRGAKLTRTGLAEIDWEGVDLRGADLRGATFHMGSTRSGLVGSTIPCEGSRTGFYTDGYNDRDFKNPEEIRKANLCHADLRGAIIDDVDFYLVDLRGAIYTPEQEEHFARCGAILDAKVM